MNLWFSCLFSEGGGPVIFLPNKRVIIARLHLRAQTQGQLFKLENNILKYSQSGHKENVIPLSESWGGLVILEIISFVFELV